MVKQQIALPGVGQIRTLPYQYLTQPLPFFEGAKQLFCKPVNQSKLET